MRIAIFEPHPSFQGGSERVVLDISRHLAAHGHELFLLHDTQGTMLPVYEKFLKGRQQMRLRAFGWRTLRATLRQACGVAHRWRTWLADLVFSSDVSYLRFLALAGSLARIPVTIHLGIPNPLPYLSQRLALRTFGVAVTPSSHTVDAWRRDGWASDRLHVIPNGVDTTRFRPAVDRCSLHGNVALINAQGQVTAKPAGDNSGREDHKGNELIDILQKNYICAPTVIARREAWMSAWPVPDGLAFNDWYFNVMMARRWEYYYVHDVLADYGVHPTNHHAQVIVNKTEEPSVLWVLNKIYREAEGDPALERAKQRMRRRVYGSQYLDLAEKYFGARMNADARRCYAEAIQQYPQLLFRVGVARRFAATIIGRAFYDDLKRLWYWHHQAINNRGLPRA